MEVKFENKIYKVITDMQGDLYVLEGGVVVPKDRCKEVKQKEAKKAKSKA